MATDISTLYAGSLQLSSPFVVASSGLTIKPSKIKEYAQAGAGAVVVKSIFEEQLEAEVARLANDPSNTAGMAEEYLAHYIKEHAIEEHLQVIRQASQEAGIPIIASINCYRQDSWLDYTRQFVEAGATAIELNVMRMESSLAQAWGEPEKALVQLVSKVKEQNLGVPITIKLSRYFTNVIKLARDLYLAGANAVVLFNRSYQHDIDISREALASGPVLSSKAEFHDGLRFASLVHGAAPELSIALSTGAQGGAELVKGLLVGADTVQYCSALYRSGSKVIEESNAFLHQWLAEHKYQSVAEMKGRLAATRVDHATTFMRSQFMKHFASEDTTPTSVYDPTKRF